MAHGRIIGIGFHRAARPPADVACAAKLRDRPLMHEGVGVEQCVSPCCLHNELGHEVQLFGITNPPLDEFYLLVVQFLFL